MTMLILESIVLPPESTLMEPGMVQKRFMQVDAETGELIEEGFVAYVAPRRQNGFGKRWFAMAHDAASVLKQVKRVEDFRC